MTDDERHKRAVGYFCEACRHQMNGHLQEAIELYSKSIEDFETAEAHIGLGWTYSFNGDYDSAIKEWQRAIRLDPGFGGVDNQFGANLIKKRPLDRAIPPLEKATPAPRYANPGVSHFNLGRVGQMKHDFRRALCAYKKALELNPDFTLAKATIQRFRTRLN